MWILLIASELQKSATKINSIMLDSYMKISFILLMAISVISIVGLIPLLLVQHFLHKAKLDPRYFNSKHYSNYELEIFNSFPLLFIKTIGYIKAIVFPNTMRNKFKDNIINPSDEPLIFFLAWLTMIILIVCGLILINTAISAIFHYTYY